MTYERDLVDRAVQVLAPQDPSFESLLRRRDRKRRSQRLAAGAVGLAIGVVVVVIGAGFLRSAGESDLTEWPLPPTTATRLVHEGEVLLNPYPPDNPTYVVAVDVATGARRTVAGCIGGCRLLTPFAGSADGGWIAYHLANCEAGECGPSDPRGGLWVVGADGPPRFVSKGFADSPWGWSPTGAQLAYADADKLILLDPTTWERTRIAVAAGTIRTIAWGPDGRAIAYSVGPPAGGAVDEVDSGVFVIRSGEEPREVSDAPGTEGIRWSPDGDSLALDRVTSDRSVIEIVAADGSSERVLVEGPMFEGPMTPVWSPDGGRIAFIRTAGEPGSFTLEIWVIGPDGQGEEQLGTPDVESWGGGPVWSPDSQRVAWASGFGSDWVAVVADTGGAPQPIDRLEVEQWIQG